MKPMHARSLMLALLSLQVAGPALAQYKVVRPDGSVTYTDRPPVEANTRVTPLGRNAAAQAAAAGDQTLPLELRQVAQRYPVTLYTAADCPPCDNGRRLLQQRGVPYVERRITTEEDALALDRVAGGRTVPALTVGAQALRGFSEGDWLSYLDAAGYPRESKLPRTWQPPAPVPMVERATPAAAAPAPARVPAPAAAAPAEPAPAPGTIRF